MGQHKQQETDMNDKDFDKIFEDLWTTIVLIGKTCTEEEAKAIIDRAFDNIKKKRSSND